MRQIQAVLFDLDGLMIDSEPLSKKAWVKLLASYGEELSDDEFAATIGLDSTASASLLKQLKKMDEDVEVLVEKCDAYRLEIITKEAEPVDGLIEMVEDLIRRDFKIGVGSNSPSNYVEAALKAINLRQKFPCVVAVDDVCQGKPAPDIYLEVARCLSVDPRSCVVIEDSPSGVKSAIAAGMRCIAVPNHDLLDSDFSDATARFDSIVELSNSLDKLLNLGED